MSQWLNAVQISFLLISQSDMGWVALLQVVTQGFSLLPSCDASVSNAGHHDSHGSERKRQHGKAALAPVLEVVHVTSTLIPLAGTQASDPNLTIGGFGIVAFLCTHKEDVV